MKILMTHFNTTVDDITTKKVTLLFVTNILKLSPTSLQWVNKIYVSDLSWISMLVISKSSYRSARLELKNVPQQVLFYQQLRLVVSMLVHILMLFSLVDQHLGSQQPLIDSLQSFQKSLHYFACLENTRLKPGFDGSELVGPRTRLSGPVHGHHCYRLELTLLF